MADRQGTHVGVCVWCLGGTISPRDHQMIIVRQGSISVLLHGQGIKGGTMRRSTLPARVLWTGSFRVCQGLASSGAVVGRRQNLWPDHQGLESKRRYSSSLQSHRAGDDGECVCAECFHGIRRASPDHSGCLYAWRGSVHYHASQQVDGTLRRLGCAPEP